MPKIIIKGTSTLDGEFDLDLSFTHRDFRTIKLTAGVRASEVMDAITAGDLDIIVALAEIALRRAGRPYDVDELLDSEAGSISLDVSDLEQELGDPSPSSDGELRNVVASPSSGDSTSDDTATSLETFPQLGSGIPRQVSGSARLTSTT